MLPAIAATAITRYTEPGDLVADPMCGIGTTLVEAGRYRPRRWVRASRWAVAQTDRRSSGLASGRALGAGSGRAVVMSVLLRAW